MTTTNTPDPYAPGTTALRVLAGVGLLLVAACVVATMMVTVADGISGDGVGGGFITAGFWAVGLAAAVGVAALVVPRRALVAAQYALALAGPVLALMD
ncbi:hypothetical protein HHL19_10380 [Streptomyces sp. R302]|uniref:hypothetical protein n=1 Tax=unclassified Streptomyces TaxID=2593676 RepID=UPI00145F44E1|nr:MULTISPECIES: hypothetical protein [unclassified Streptomyces]NML50074.1 hypothetical protein [Streptomyces sp. R301]NML79065.1 hypothetical protein [Streptomyces sp. R302]